MRRALVTMLLSGVLVILGLVRLYFFDAGYINDTREAGVLWKRSSEHVVFVDEISSSSPAGTKFFARLESVQRRILVKAAYVQDLLLGEKLVIQGKLKSIAVGSSESFANYLKLKNVVGIVEYPQVFRCIEQRHSFAQYFLSFRNLLTGRIQKTFSQDVAGFLNGILLGDDDFLSKQTQEQFRVAGLTHVMAISGSNMTMIAEMVFLLLAFLPLKKKIVVTTIILTTFTLVVGASAAVVRAYLMAIIALTALHFGLPYLALRGLLFVVIAMFLLSPYIPLYDIGFQLSVMATLGLLIVNPLLSRALQFLPYLWLREIVAITLSASIFTLPISLHYFGTWFPLSLVVNILLVPVISALSLISYLGVALTLVPLFGETVRFTLEIVFRLLLWFVEFAASISSHVQLEVSFSWLYVFIYYLVVWLSVRFFVWKYPGKTSRANILP